MEHVGSFDSRNQRLPSLTSGSRLTDGSKNNARFKDNYDYVMREHDCFIPMNNVIRIMCRIVPTHAKIFDNAKETIQECVYEFISFITTETKERCQHKQRKTITADDMLWSMANLGFYFYDEKIRPPTYPANCLTRGTRLTDGSKNNASNGDDHGYVVREQDYFIPIASIDQIISRTSLPMLRYLMMQKRQSRNVSLNSLGSLLGR